jgi:ribosomal-protein-alanine N-acetyltransferase
MLETERLVLRKLEKVDAEPLFYGLRNQPEFLYYTNKKKITLEEQLENFNSIEEKYENLEYYNWVIVLKETGDLVGMINFHVENRNDSVEFNYAIDNRFWGRGIMTEALRAVTKFALEEMKVNRIQGGCVVENNASRRVIEKCGYEFEGVLKSYVKLDDGYHDMNMFSIINKEC